MDLCFHFHQVAGQHDYVLPSGTARGLAKGGEKDRRESVDKWNFASIAQDVRATGLWDVY